MRYLSQIPKVRYELFNVFDLLSLIPAAIDNAI